MKAAILLISFVTILLGVVAAPAWANPGAQDVGAVPCRTAERNWPRDGDRYMTWGEGFLSSLTSQTDGPPNLNPDDFPGPVQTLFIQGYCQTHPDDELANAFIELHRDIVRNHGGTSP